MNLREHWFALAAVALLSAWAVGCGNDDNNDGSPTSVPTTAAQTPLSGGSTGTTVTIRLNEYSVAPDAESAVSGPIAFQVTNKGPKEEHEFVVVRTELAPDALPTQSDGSVNEDAVDVVDEIEEFPVGETMDLTVDLGPGSYVLICNVVQEQDGQTISHYERGMFRAFTAQ